MNKQMKSWTGFTGNQDQALRVSGRTFLLAIRDGGEPELATEGVIESGDYDDYCNVAAPDEATAVANYDRAFIQWRDSENGTNELEEIYGAAA